MGLRHARMRLTIAGIALALLTLGASADEKRGKLRLHVDGLPDPASTGIRQRSDRAVVQAYLKKYQLPLSDDLPFHAGFVVLEGAANLGFDDHGVLHRYMSYNCNCDRRV